ncbi:MAG: hypothetical protein ABII23_06805 [bacterium]
MKLRKNIGKLKKHLKEEDSFVDASPQERISFMWELTEEIWSLSGADYAERRLQRNVTNLIKP